MSALHAQEIPQLRLTGFHSRPVVIQGIRQPSLHRLVGARDLLINGNKIRVPTDTVIALTSSGRTSIGLPGSHGTLEQDLTVDCLDGNTRVLPRGSTVEVIQC